MSSRHCVCESVYLAGCLSQNRSSVHDLSIVSAVCLFSVPFSTHSPFHPSLLLFFPSLSGFSLLSHFSLTPLEQHVLPVTLHILPSEHLLLSCPLTPAGFPFKGAMGRWEGLSASPPMASGSSGSAPCSHCPLHYISFL